MESGTQKLERTFYFLFLAFTDAVRTAKFAKRMKRNERAIGNDDF